MEDSLRGTSSFSAQANALFRKNLTFQRRNLKTNLRIILFPIILCLVLAVIQKMVDDQLNKHEKRCGCKCVDTKGDGTCENVCGIQYSKGDQVFSCPVPRPLAWPPLLQIPRLENRAARTKPGSLTGLPDPSCRNSKDCPATILFTGGDQTLARSVSKKLFNNSPFSSSDLSSIGANPADILSSVSNLTLGTDTHPTFAQFLEPALISKRPIYSLQSTCCSTSEIPIDISISDNFNLQSGEQCLQGLNVWCDNSSVVNEALFQGYRRGNTDGSINEYVAAYDFLNSSMRNLNVNIWYNSTYKNATIWGPPPALSRVLRSVNLVSNAYLQSLRGSHVKMQFEFTKEMPKSSAPPMTLDFSILLGPLFYKWVIELIFPVLLTHLVYEKQYKLRTMMKMHGLGDGPYWIVTYGYFLFISLIYVLFIVAFGSLIGLEFFTLNDYNVQFVFFFSYINLQIVLAFLTSTVFSIVKTAEAIAYIYILGTGILAGHLLRYLIEDPTFPAKWTTIVELVPAFSLCRGLYEFEQFTLRGKSMGTRGIRWKNLTDGDGGMRDALFIIILEWCILLPLAYYLDQMTSLGSRIRKNPLPFLGSIGKKFQLPFRRKSFQIDGCKVFVEVDKPDVIEERMVVEKTKLDPSAADFAIVSDNLRKVYPGQDGNPNKLAVQSMSLALSHGECFGFLGPNGAGKTSFINMMIGLITPSSGNAYVQGYSIQTDMDKIYTSMGVCPQHDMLWELLTGREHLMFYGRLKNLNGPALLQAVEESLDSVNLLNGGFGDQQVGKYSGGMKRRLSVAISLIGDPKVVYMDEPTTGLDPASRNNLWNVVKKAKKNKAIILTTHSMEEAEFLCDRLGIFVSGSMQCIGNPKQLKARYGGSYVFTMTTPRNEEQKVEKLVRCLSPSANKIYHISGTQKFEIPKHGIRIADIFGAVDEAKRKFPIQTWGLADTTLEDVFIKVTRGADYLDLSRDFKQI